MFDWKDKGSSCDIFQKNFESKSFEFRMIVHRQRKCSQKGTLWIFCVLHFHFFDQNHLI